MSAAQNHASADLDPVVQINHFFQHSNVAAWKHLIDGMAFIGAVNMVVKFPSTMMLLIRNALWFPNLV